MLLMMNTHKGFVFICLLVVGQCQAKAQDATVSLKTEAQKYFIERNYEKALSKYRELLIQFPKEPGYQYGAGTCLVILNHDTEYAINLLRSAGNANYDPLAWYYLGQALHMNYQFEDAIKAFSKFLLLGKNKDIKTLEVERKIQMAKNGLELTRIGLNLNVIEVKALQIDQMENASEINRSGKLIKKPVEFCNKSDLREDYRPLMYLPIYTELNEFVFVSGYVKNNKGRKQIFRVKNINHETWSVPELLSVIINTPYDDAYPYFDNRASVLYFSSKGHSSMGGYDIFRSFYDWNAKSWSKPENMGFPINSPYDDYFYITDEYLKTASFVSNRKTGPSNANLYKLRLTEDSTGFLMSDIEEIKQESDLKVKPIIRSSEPVPEEYSAVPAIFIAGKQFTAPAQDYNKLLAEAMNIQIKADSLSRMARDKRLQASETPDSDVKKQLVTDLIRVEKEAKRLQREADKKFAAARILRGSTNSGASTTYEAVTVANTVALQDEFSLLENSPYSDANPFILGIGNADGLIYRIQLGAFSKPRPWDAFGGITPVCYEQVANTTLLKYYAGRFYTVASVTYALEKVREKGFPDAFIVAFFDGKLISTEKAMEVEFETFQLQ